MADNPVLVGHLGLEEDFSSNILFVPSTDEPESDAIRTLDAGLSFDHRSPRSSQEISGFLRNHTYRDHADLDSTDIQADMYARSAITSRLAVQGHAGYTRDSLITRDIGITGQPLNATARRILSADGHLFSDLNPTIETDMGMDYQRFDYSGSTNVDSRAGTAMLKLNWRADRYIPRASFGIEADHSRYRYVDAALTHADYDMLQALASWQTTELLQIDLRLGGGRTCAHYAYQETSWEIEYPGDGSPPLIVPMTATVEETARSQGFVGALDLSYAGYRSFCGLHVSHDIDLANGSTSVTQRSAVRLDYRVSLPPKLSVGMTGAFIINHAHQSNAATEDTDERTVSLQPNLRYHLTRHMTLTLGYAYALLRDYAAHETRRSNTTSLGIDIADELFSKHPLL